MTRAQQAGAKSDRALSPAPAQAPQSGCREREKPVTRRRSVEALHLRHVGEIVCARLGARPPKFDKRVRRHGPRMARFMTFYLAHVHYRIGKRMLSRIGGYHVSTVVHMIESVEDWRDDPKIDALLDELEGKLRGKSHVEPRSGNAQPGRKWVAA